MATRVRLFDRAGSELAEIQCKAPRSWVLNGVGKATLFVPKSDVKATDNNLRFGNLVLIEHDRVPPWGGVLWMPQQWTDDEIQCSAFTAEFLLKYRRNSDFGQEHRSLSSLIGEANQVEDTRIRHVPGSFDGRTYGDEWRDIIYDMIERIFVKGQGFDWSIEPRVDWTGRLLFDMRLHRERRGQQKEAALMEGVNIEKSGDTPLMTVQGDIRNDAVVARAGVKSYEEGRYVWDGSTAIYGVRQALEYADGSSATTLEEQARTLIRDTKFPTRTFVFNVLDHANMFDNIRLGNVLPIWLTRYGFADNQPEASTIARIHQKQLPEGASLGGGARGPVNFQTNPNGLFTFARVMAMSYDESTGAMPVVLDEVEL